MKTPKTALETEQNRFSLEKAHAAMRSKLEDQARLTRSMPDGYTIRPTGKGGVGWELIPPALDSKQHNPVWYLATEAQAVAALSRHREHYAH